MTQTLVRRETRLPRESVDPTPDPLTDRDRPQPTVGDESRKISLNLHLRDWDALRDWAAEEDTTVSELVRRALRLLRALENEQAHGTVILLREKGKRTSRRLARLKRVDVVEDYDEIEV